MRRSLLHPCAVLIAAGVLLAGCGRSGPEPGAAGGRRPRQAATTTSAPRADQPGAGRAQLVKPRPGLEEVRAQPFHKLEVGNDRRTLTVFYWGGLEACYGLDRVDVRYAPKTVRLTVYQGRVPEAEVCAQVAQYKATRVMLTQALAGRRIVDGARR